MDDTLPHTGNAQPQGFLSTSGAAMRDRAIGVLAARHAELVERSKRRELTSVERAEVSRLGAIIDTMQTWGGPCEP